MAKFKLLILDNTEDFPMALSEVLQDRFHIQYCLDGKEGLAMLRSFQPDILLLELMLPNLDGISLLQAAAADGLHPVVLTITRFYNEYMMTTLAKLNVSYWMIKPCDLTATANRVLDLIPQIGQQNAPARNPEKQASELLLLLGFSTKHNGYNYLLEAIVMEARTPDQSVTKHLYPAIAAKYNCCHTNVEHAIRTAINSAWLKRDDAIWQQYFTPGPDGGIPRPTNRSFISRLAREIRQK